MQPDPSSMRKPFNGMAIFTAIIALALILIAVAVVALTFKVNALNERFARTVPPSDGTQEKSDYPCKAEKGCGPIQHRQDGVVWRETYFYGQLLSLDIVKESDSYKLTATVGGGGCTGFEEPTWYVKNNQLFVEIIRSDPETLEPGTTGGIMCTLEFRYVPIIVKIPHTSLPQLVSLDVNNHPFTVMALPFHWEDPELPWNIPDVLTTTNASSNSMNDSEMIGPNTPFTLGVGQTAMLKDDSEYGGEAIRSVTLIKINDSRCKPGVVCIWEGELAAEIRYMDGSGTVRNAVVGNRRNSCVDGLTLESITEDTATFSKDVACVML